MKHLGVEIFEASTGTLVFDTKGALSFDTNPHTEPTHKSSTTSRVHIRQNEDDNTISLTTNMPMPDNNYRRQMMQVRMDKMTALALSHQLRKLAIGV